MGGQVLASIHRSRFRRERSAPLITFITGEIRMPIGDRSSTPGPSWTIRSFLAAVASPRDRDRAARLFELHESLPNSYYWFGQQPNGAVFFHPLGLRYAPMSVWINASGDLMGRGAWSSYPQIRKDEGFAELASFVGQDHLGSASGFPIAEHDVEKLWAHILGCAQKINGAS
jgi:hypothetical protein